MGPEHREQDFDGVSMDSNGSDISSSNKNRKPSIVPNSNGVTKQSNGAVLESDRVSVLAQEKFEGVEPLPECKLANMTIIMTKSIENGFYR